MPKITVDPVEQRQHGMLMIAAAAAIVGPQGQRPWKEYAQELVRKMDVLDGHLLTVAGDFFRTVRVHAIEVVEVLDQWQGSGGGVVCWREDGDGPYRGSPEGWKHKAHTFFADSPAGAMILADARAVMAAGQPCQVVIGYEHPGGWEGKAGEAPDAIKKIVAVRYDRRAVQGLGQRQARPDRPPERPDEAPEPPNEDTNGAADARTARAARWYSGLDTEGQRRVRQALRGGRFAELDEEGWAGINALKAELDAARRETAEAPAGEQPAVPGEQPASSGPADDEQPVTAAEHAARLAAAATEQAQAGPGPLPRILDAARERAGGDDAALLDTEILRAYGAFWSSLDGDQQTAIRAENRKLRAPLETLHSPATLADLRQIVVLYHRAEVARELAALTGG